MQLDGQALGALGQGRIAQGLPGAHHSQPLWLPAGRLIDELVNHHLGKGARYRWRLGRRQCPVTHRARCGGDQLLQQLPPVAGHLLNGGRFEQLGGIGEAGLQLVAALMALQHQFAVTGTPLRRQRFEHQPGSSLQPGDVEHLGLVVEQGLEGLAMALIAHGTHQGLEWQVLMGLGPQSGGLDPRQQGPTVQLRVQLGLQQLGVDETADQAFDLGAVAVGHRHRNTDRTLAAITLQ
ncbi:hypothetical protein D3C80_609640 [compost metagenome]